MQHTCTGCDLARAPQPAMSSAEHNKTTCSCACQEGQHRKHAHLQPHQSLRLAHVPD